MSEISQLQPQAVWQWFDRICEVPRPTYHEEKIGRFLKGEAEKKGLDVEMDAKGNLRIDAPGTGSLTGAPMVVLQTHMDMVPQKNEGVEHDFLKDPIKPRIEDGWVKATGTTLGGDDGIGLAIALAFVFDETGVEHPPLRLIVTVEEEIGMGGAIAVDPKWLDAPYMLNIDTEEDGSVYLGCAGGRYTVTRVPMRVVEPRGKAWKLRVKGLRGGHSGIDIGTGVGNANYILMRILSAIYDKSPFCFGDFKGGSAKNSIPRDAEAIIWTEAPLEEWKGVADETTAIILDEIRALDPGLVLVIEETTCERCYGPKCTRRAIDHARAHPNGVQRMSDEFPGIVETSLSAGVFYVEDDALVIEAFMRSLRETPKDELASRIESLTRLTENAKFEMSEDFPGWNPNPDSKLLEMFKQAYKKVAGKEAKVEIIHAGLECGLLLAKSPKMDIISFGPTIIGAHSPEERVNIESVGNIWNVMIELLRNVK